MSIEEGFKKIGSKVDAYKSTIQTTVNEKSIKKIANGDTLAQTKSKALKQ